MERFFDILISTFTLIAISPLFVPIVIILKFTGEGEIFFFQERVGKDGVVFKLIKFATMLKDSPNIGTGTVTVSADPRVLPFGKILRKTKINELPQLLNIFFGNMSLIGPRPLTLQTFEAYSPRIQEVVKKVKPGLSGIGSIIFRDEENIMQGASASVEFYDNTIAPYKGALEVWYVSNKGLYIYFLAIFMTAWIVLIPNTQMAWRIFSKLPEPPAELKKALKYLNFPTPR